MNIAEELDRQEMKQQFRELRRSIEKAREAYHRQSQKLKKLRRMNILADGLTRRTLKARASSILDVLLSFWGIYKTLTLWIMMQLSLIQ